MNNLPDREQNWTNTNKKMTSAVMKSNNFNYYYSLADSRTLVCCLHGWICSLNNWANLFSSAKKQFNFLVFDYPGHNTNSHIKFPKPSSFREDLLKILIAVIDDIIEKSGGNIDKIVFYGSSMGALVLLDQVRVTRILSNIETFFIFESMPYNFTVNDIMLSLALGALQSHPGITKRIFSNKRIQKVWTSQVINKYSNNQLKSEGIVVFGMENTLPQAIVNSFKYMGRLKRELKKGNIKINKSIINNYIFIYGKRDKLLLPMKLLEKPEKYAPEIDLKGHYKLFNTGHCISREKNLDINSIFHNKL